MIFVDTSYFLASAVVSDQHHVRARSWNAVLTDRLLVTEYVLIEKTVNALCASPVRERAKKIIQSVMTEDAFIFIGASRAWLNAGLNLFQKRPDKDWSLTDCISFEVMRSEQIKSALTYDHHFVQAGFDALLRRDPP